VLLDGGVGVVVNPVGKSERVRRAAFTAAWFGVPLLGSEVDLACPGAAVTVDA
jgi:hypothetical protein